MALCLLTCKDDVVVQSVCFYMSLFAGDQELPDQFSQASVSTEGHGSPCCLVIISILAAHTILMVTQAKELLKLKLGHLKAHNHDETVTKHLIFLFIEIASKPSARINLST